MTDLSTTADALLEGLPDLVLVVRRDGVVLQCGGGHGVPDLRPSRDLAGQRLEAVWSRPVASLLRQLARRAITSPISRRSSPPGSRSRSCARRSCGCRLNPPTRAPRNPGGTWDS